MYQSLAALLGPFPALYILITAGLAVLWRKRVDSRRRLLLVTVPFIVLGILSTPAVGYLALGSLEWRYLPNADLPRDHQAIVVLSGDIRLPDARVPDVELGDATLLRCLHAAQIYYDRPCPVVVCGGKMAPQYARTHAGTSHA